MLTGDSIRNTSEYFNFLWFRCNILHSFMIQRKALRAFETKAVIIFSGIVSANRWRVEMRSMNTTAFYICFGSFWKLFPLPLITKKEKERKLNFASAEHIWMAACIYQAF